jgi:hypothetical protein
MPTLAHHQHPCPVAHIKELIDPLNRYKLRVSQLEQYCRRTFGAEGDSAPKVS